MNEEDMQIQRLRDAFGPAPSPQADPRIAFYEMGYAAGKAVSKPSESAAYRHLIAASLLAVVVGGVSFFAGRLTGDDVQQVAVDNPDPPLETVLKSRPASEPPIDHLAARENQSVESESISSQPAGSLGRPALPQLDLLDLPGFALVGGEVRMVAVPTPEASNTGLPSRMMHVSDILQPNQFIN